VQLNLKVVHKQAVTINFTSVHIYDDEDPAGSGEVEMIHSARYTLHMKDRIAGAKALTALIALIPKISESVTPLR